MCFYFATLPSINQGRIRSEPKKILQLNITKGLGLRWGDSCKCKVRFCLYIKPSILFSMDWGGVNFLKIFHKMLFTLITEFNWTPLSFVLEVHAHLHHLSSMFWSLLHIKIWFKQEQAKLMFLQWVPTEFREWYPEVMKDRHVLSQYLGKMVRNFCGFDSSRPLLKDIFIYKV